ncbi:MAG: hypothetical protein P4L51_20205 [Puia sp.]|nr:hypothetical protein [Puia sp.]
MTNTKIILLFSLLLCCGMGYAQSKTAKDTAVVPIFTADSLASGNYKDVLSSFYQLAINNLTGPNKELKFTSNPYAIMLKNNPDLKRYSEYKKYQVWRRFNFTVDAKLDSAYQFNGFSSAITYALVNRRDYTLRNTLFTQDNKANNDTMFTRLSIVLDARLLNPKSFLIFDTLFGRETADSVKTDTAAAPDLEAEFGKRVQSFIDLDQQFYSARSQIIYRKDISTAEKNSLIDSCQKALDDSTETVINKISIATGHGMDDASVKKYHDKYISIRTAFAHDLKVNLDSLYNDSLLTFEKVDARTKSWIFQDLSDPSIKYLQRLVDSNPKLIVAKQQRSDYDSLIASFGKKGLWTVGVSDTSYKDGGLFKSVQFYTEYLKGILHPSDMLNIELDLKATVNFLDDSLRTGKNLTRQYWEADPGFNLVFNGKQSHKSFLEFKVSGGFSHVFKGYYANDKALDITLDGTLRLRVFNEVWIPLQIKYDPKSGNVFGFLSITTNFTSLASMLKSSQGQGKKS